MSGACCFEGAKEYRRDIDLCYLFIYETEFIIKAENSVELHLVISRLIIS